MTPTLDRGRFRGALLGLAVGDAIGTTVEFKPPGTFAEVTDMVGGGPFGLPAGAWTDDTSMALCLAESLVERAGFDPVDQLQRYVSWYREGHLSSTGTCFDIGNATRKALHRFEKTGEPFPGDADRNAAGNGPLMKLAPVALAYAKHPLEAVLRAAESARTTHGAPQATDATRYFAGLLVGALAGADVSQLLHQGAFEPSPGIWDQNPLHPEVAEVAAGSFLAKEPPAIQGAGYIVRALEAALWALMKTRTFEDGVLLAVNLGDDADTTAAIYGQLAGALYGVDAIPARWRAQLAMRERIEELADELFVLAERIAPASRPRPPATAASPSPPAPPGDSYWVLDGQLLAGPYPGAPKKAEAAAKLEAFLDAGVTCFVDLTEEGEGPPLHPYSGLLRRLARKRKTRVTHLRLPIRDVDIPTSWQMRATLGAIRLALAEGETVYVHCWGGVGRTGTLIGCLLVEDGIPAGEVLDRLARLRRDTQRAHRTSPETHEQRMFVEHWSAQDTLVLDQHLIDRMGITAVPSDPSPVPNLGEIVAALGNGAPVVIEGPEPGWCVQAVAQDGFTVRVEVLDPEHWESGPALSREHQRTIEQLGFTREPSAWARVEQDDDGIAALRRSAELMLAVVLQAWGLEAHGALRLDDVPTPDGPWDRISEFAHTFNGYAHFGENWGERVSAVRDRYFETDALPDDIDDLRACLFCEFRMDRFTWGDDVTLSEPDDEGVRHIIGNPDFESSPTQRYRRAVIARIRDLLAGASDPATRQTGA
jgi:ADP-ribosylglycohydrolase